MRTRRYTVSCLLSFVPGDDWRKTNLVHARKESERGEDERSPDELVLIEESKNVEWLKLVSYVVLTSSISLVVCTFSLDFSLIWVSFTAGDAVWPATFLLRSSSACASLPVVRAVAMFVVNT